MLKRVIIPSLILVLAFSIMSCGRGSDPTSPAGDGMVRILGGKFPATVISLIAFTRGLPDSENIYGINNELFIMMPNGAYQHRLTWNPADDDYPAFAPHGHALAFVSNRASGGYGNHDVFRLGSFGGVTQLTDEAWQFDSFATDYGPGFITAAQINTLVGAPFDVGRVIALHPFGKWEKFVDTGHIVSYDPAVGKKPNLLVFCARPQGATYFGDMELYLMVDWLPEPYRITYFGDENPDPTDLVFTRNPQFDRTGTKIIFQTTYWDDNWEIGYIDLESADAVPQPIRLTNNPAADVEPCWNPAGNWFAWCTDRDGNFEIYRRRVWDPNSPNPIPPAIRLTYTKVDESNPDWGRIGPYKNKY